MGYNPLIVPAQDSVANATTMDVVGNKTDSSAGTSVLGRLVQTYNHFHSPGRLYPSKAAAVTITKASTSAWGEDALPTEVIPASTITEAFDIHYIYFGTISANDAYELSLWSGAGGAETEICRVAFDRSTTQTEGVLYSQIPIQAANARIFAKLTSADSASRSVSIKLMYHTY